MSLENITRYEFDSVPLNRDIFLIGGGWLRAYENCIDGTTPEGSQDPSFLVSYAAVRKTSGTHLELSWYPNIFDRFHEVRVNIEKGNFICCMHSWRSGEKPVIFVTDEWIEGLHHSFFSSFALIDAIGVKKKLTQGESFLTNMVSARGALDKLAEEYPECAIFSFSDSVIVKINWSVGTFDSETCNTYGPEKLLQIVKRIFDIFRSCLGLSCYACFAQGSNLFSAGAVMHRSSAGNHISFNSLGMAFAEIFSMEQAVRAAIRSEAHDCYDLYLDSKFFRSLHSEARRCMGAVLERVYSCPLGGGEQTYVCVKLGE